MAKRGLRKKYVAKGGGAQALSDDGLALLSVAHQALDRMDGADVLEADIVPALVCDLAWPVLKFRSRPLKAAVTVPEFSVGQSVK